MYLPAGSLIGVIGPIGAGKSALIGPLGGALRPSSGAILLDGVGLAPIVIDRLYEAPGALRRAGLTMIIIEQDVERALDIAGRAYVLEHGSVALEGTASSIRADARLRHRYVGTAD